MTSTTKVKFINTKTLIRITKVSKVFNFFVRTSDNFVIMTELPYANIIREISKLLEERRTLIILYRFTEFEIDL